MLEMNINKEPSRLNKNPATIKITAKFKNGLSLFKRCISMFLFVKNVIPVNNATNVKSPVMNGSGFIMLYSYLKYK